MVDFKKKLTAFYGKDYTKEPKQGGFFAISTGDFIHNNGYFAPDWVTLDFRRTDGKTRRTAEGRRQEAANKKRFFENLERIGIIWVDSNSTTADFLKIANFFTNSNSPRIKKNIDRKLWAEN